METIKVNVIGNDLQMVYNGRCVNVTLNEAWETEQIKKALMAKKRELEAELCEKLTWDDEVLEAFGTMVAPRYIKFDGEWVTLWGEEGGVAYFKEFIADEDDETGWEKLCALDPMTNLVDVASMGEGHLVPWRHVPECVRKLFPE